MAADDKKNHVETAKEVVEKLYSFRDHYFEHNAIEKAGQKEEDVKREMHKTFDDVQKYKDNFSNKAEYFMLLGKILNVTSDYDPKAEEHLSKAVKLDPKLVEAWNQLGEAYWKKGNINGAKNCFTGALTHIEEEGLYFLRSKNKGVEGATILQLIRNFVFASMQKADQLKNKVSLRNLSMVLRQLNVSSEERSKNIEQSVEKAKEAVQLDIKDGMSWLILGNAYLSLFFDAGQNPKVLGQAMSAYKQAEKDPVAKNNADLHYNRSTAYKFQEDFQSALEGFSQASLLDPGWKEPELQEKRLLLYLTCVSDLVEAKGKVKGKRLQTLSQSPRESALGPYAGGSYTSHSGKSVKLDRCYFSELHDEVNSEKVVMGKVVCTVPSEDPVPFTFCMLDEEETCLSVNVYNIAKGSGVKIGDSVAIPEPYIQPVKVKHKGKEFNFRSIRVNTPVVLVVNGRKLGREKQAATVLSVSALSD